LLGDIEAFYLEHRRCGELESEASEHEPCWVVMECSCGARLVRPVTGSGDARRHSA